MSSNMEHGGGTSPITTEPRHPDMLGPEPLESDIDDGSDEVMSAIRHRHADVATVIEGGQAFVAAVLRRSGNPSVEESRQMDSLAMTIGYGLLTLDQDPETVSQKLGESLERLLDLPPGSDDKSSIEKLGEVASQIFTVQPIPDLTASIKQAAQMPTVQRALDIMDTYGLDTASRVHI